MEKDVAADAAAQKEEEEQLAKLGEDMGTCLFSEYMGTLIGIGAGVAFGTRRKSFYPLLIGGVAGSVVDLIYGMGFSCQQQVKAYQRCRDAIEARKRGPLPPLPPGVMLPRPTVWREAEPPQEKENERR